MTMPTIRVAVFGWVLVLVLGAGCAHQQAIAPVLAEAPPLAPAAPPQVAVTPAPSAAPDGQAELEQALQGATAYFEFNGDQLSAGGMASLQRVAEVLRKYAALQVLVEGHCDERGTQEYNLMLGQRRAEMARKYLLALGVRAPQVDTLSHGAERPADPRHTDDAWARNRRADVQRASN